MRNAAGCFELTDILKRLEVWYVYISADVWRFINVIRELTTLYQPVFDLLNTV